MMAGIPTNFQAISNVLANYNFVDIASGTGYITFYAGKTVDLNILSNFTYYSDILYTEGVALASTNNYLSLDVDFDTLVNRPLDVKGLAIVNIPVNPSTSTTTTYAIVYFRKWDGVSETNIANNTSRTSGTGGTTSFYMLSVDLDIPLTHFKKGETMRLTIMLYSNKSTVGDSAVRFAHDPKNRVSDGTLDWDLTGAVPSQLSFQCPVRLNL
jgi:hypothetical protein